MSASDKLRMPATLPRLLDRRQLAAELGVKLATAETDPVTTWLYVFAAPHGCKVGITRMSVAERKADLERACGFALDVIESWEFDSHGEVRTLEGWVHFVLREHRLLGEWFAVSPLDAVQAVEDCRREAPDGLFLDKDAFLARNGGGA